MTEKEFCILALVVNLLSFSAAYGIYMHAADGFLYRHLDGWTFVTIVLVSNVLVTAIMAACAIVGRR